MVIPVHIVQWTNWGHTNQLCEYKGLYKTIPVTVSAPKMGLNNNDIPDGLSIVDKYVQTVV